MSDKEVFAQFAREQGLNEERVESARQAGVNITTLVSVCSVGLCAAEVEALLAPVSLGHESAAELAVKAGKLVGMRR